MASTDWIDATSSLSSASVRRQDTAGFTPPNGGGIFTYGFNSVDGSPGVVARYCQIVSTPAVNPTTKGGDISAALQRSTLSAKTTGFAVFIFFCLQTTDVSGSAYMLGLSDANPAHIVLRKGPLSGALPDVPPAQQGVLARSTDAFAAGSWWHVRLEVVVNTNGDVVLNVYQNDLTQHPTSLPVWTPIAGMPQIVDDALGVNTGSLPLASGRLGYGFATTAAGRVALVDEIRPTIQL